MPDLDTLTVGGTPAVTAEYKPVPAYEAGGGTIPKTALRGVVRQADDTPTALGEMNERLAALASRDEWLKAEIADARADAAAAVAIEAVHIVGAANEPAYGPQFDFPGNTIRFHRDRGFVRIWGNVSDPGWGANSLIFTLPEGYRPDVETKLACPGWDNVAGRKIWTVRVQVDGQVVVEEGTTSGDNGSIEFNGFIKTA